MKGGKKMTRHEVVQPQSSERPLPANWPKDRPLPTIEQARDVVREAEDELEEYVKSHPRQSPPPGRQFTI